MEHSTGNTDPITPGLPEALASPDAYPNDPDAAAGVRVIQTHLSDVYLTRGHVYKLHRDVDVGFVSFTTQRARNEDALRELQLNRRLAPDVYLGLAPVEPSGPGGEGFRVGATIADPQVLGSGEYCIVMRRLPDGRDARSLLEAGRLDRDAIARLAGRLAVFHREHTLGRPSAFSPGEWSRSIADPVERNFESLLRRTPGVVREADVTRLRERAEHALERLAPRFERRRVDGRAVDAHGDLHLSHVWLETDEADPIVIDCLAFDEGLRHIDAASDLAFLAMDLAYRDHPELAEHLLACYAAAADDYDLYSVIDFYMGYRAAVRAKVAALEAVDPGIEQSQRTGAVQRAQRRIDFALAALAPRPPGRVTLVGGIIGTGKSTAARALARETGAVVLSSDEIRRVVDAGEESSGGWREGRYAPDVTERVYAALLERAEPVVSSGRNVVLDASWSSRERRERAGQAAAAWGAKLLFVEVRCPREITLARLEERRRRGGDASEAGPEIYEAFASSFEPPDELPGSARLVVDSSQPGWEEGLREALRLSPNATERGTATHSRTTGPQEPPSRPGPVPAHSAREPASGAHMGVSTIVAAFDFSTNSTLALERAQSLARRHRARVVLAHAFAPISSSRIDLSLLPPEFEVDSMKAVMERLEEEATRLADGVEVLPKIERGAPAATIVAIATDEKADLIVTGSRGLSGFDHALLGSTAEAIVGQAPCPVLVVHENDVAPLAPPSRVLLPTDLTSDIEVVAETLERLSGAITENRPPPQPLPSHPHRVPPLLQPALHTLTGVDLMPFDQVRVALEAKLEPAAAKLKERGFDVSIEIEEGEPSTRMIELAGRLDVDLVAMTTHGRHGIAKLFLGSTARRVVQHAPCPVLTVPRPETA